MELLAEADEDESPPDFADEAESAEPDVLESPDFVEAGAGDVVLDEPPLRLSVR